MNKKAQVVTVLIFLIALVFLSAIILGLLSTGILKTKEGPEEPILNTQFLPMGENVNLAVNELKFCKRIDQELNCIEEGNLYERGQTVYLSVLVFTSSLDSSAGITRQYQITSPSGEILLSFDQSEPSPISQQILGRGLVIFTDYFITPLDAELGEYQLELLIVDNNREITEIKEFTLIINENFEEQDYEES